MKGFTLVELIVSIAIFAVMTALVIARYGTFNQNTILTNMAYDMALTMRTAQTYGVSVKSASVSGSADAFGSAYGIRFPSNDGASRTHFRLYSYSIGTDASGQATYTADPQPITTYTVTQGATISQICFGTDPTQCTATKLVNSDQLDIIYRRPNPNAIFMVNNVSVVQPIAFISVTSQDGTKTETIYVRKNGQISVGN
jgi:prepilin-type N-terminal cleavage/methylation domain-containing protein